MSQWVHVWCHSECRCDVSMSAPLMSQWVHVWCQSECTHDVPISARMKSYGLLRTRRCINHVGLFIWSLCGTVYAPPWPASCCVNAWMFACVCVCFYMCMYYILIYVCERESVYLHTHKNLQEASIIEREGERIDISFVYLYECMCVFMCLHVCFCFWRCDCIFF